MAPLPTPTLTTLTRILLARSPALVRETTTSSPKQTSSAALARISQAANPLFGSGSKPATDFNNKFFLALFALLGAAGALAAIWFFFWARNGGFKFQEGDWDDYKSTVLR